MTILEFMTNNNIITVILFAFIYAVIVDGIAAIKKKYK